MALRALTSAGLLPALACLLLACASEVRTPGATGDADSATEDTADDGAAAGDAPEPDADPADADLLDTAEADAAADGSADAAEIDADGDSSASDAISDTSTDAADVAPDIDLPDTPDPGLDVDVATDTDPDIAADANAVASIDATPDIAADVPTEPDVAPVECVDLSGLAEPAPAPGLPTVVGTHETLAGATFTDDYLVDAAGYLQVGVRREWGGSIVFYGLRNGRTGPNAANTIDANDTGREVQVALYDPDRQLQGCAFDASCRSGGTPCPTSIRYLGWNPVQGGNRCNRGSGVEGVSFADGVLTVVTQPLQWNPDWDQPTCGGDGCGSAATRERRSDVRIEQRMRWLRTHVLEIEYVITNLADLDHRLAEHELPTLYSANGNAGPDLWRLMTSTGTQIAIDVPANDGFFYKNFDSGAPWVSLQDDALTYGVGLFMENGLTSFQGWQNRALPFNNVRARFPFAVPALGTIRARAYLLLGALSTQQTDAAWLTANLPPFGTVDSPTEGPWAGDAVTVRGWFLDNRPGTRVDVVVDGARTLPAALGSERSDACLVWPGYPDCPNPGFSVSLSPEQIGDPRCDHVIDVVAVDANGNRALLGRRWLRAR